MIQSKSDYPESCFAHEESIDFACTRPPYSDIIKYSEDGEKDFLCEMRSVAAESHRAKKKDCFCAILMGDTRKKGHVVPMSFEVMTHK